MPVPVPKNPHMLNKTFFSPKLSAKSSRRNLLPVLPEKTLDDGQSFALKIYDSVKRARVNNVYHVMLDHSLFFSSYLTTYVIIKLSLKNYTKAVKFPFFQLGNGSGNYLINQTHQCGAGTAIYFSLEPALRHFPFRSRRRINIMRLRKITTQNSPTELRPTIPVPGTQHFSATELCV
jgi:hypothetical protein